MSGVLGDQFQRAVDSALEAALPILTAIKALLIPIVAAVELIAEIAAGAVKLLTPWTWITWGGDSKDLLGQINDLEPPAPQPAQQRKAAVERAEAGRGVRDAIKRLTK